MNWNEDSIWEKVWWGNCSNTYGEEEKQLVYAEKMGIKTYHNGNSPYNFAVSGKILDIGGGPVSMLLKCPNAQGTVYDPCDYPDWIADRYHVAGIFYDKRRGEDINQTGFDEVWFYNVLQHTEDPEKICKNALKAGKLVRVFEWIENGISKGHPHNLTEKGLNEWLEGVGKVEKLNTPTCKGLAYYGIFKGVL